MSVVKQLYLYSDNNADWYTALWKNVSIIKVFLPLHLITSLLGIYPKKIILKEKSGSRRDDVIETVCTVFKIRFDINGRKMAKLYLMK